MWVSYNAQNYDPIGSEAIYWISENIIYSVNWILNWHFDETADILKDAILVEIKSMQESITKNYLDLRVERYDKLGVFRED